MLKSCFFQRGLLLLISVWPWRLTRIFELPGVRTNTVTNVIRLFPVDDITQNRYFVIVQLSSYYRVSRANKMHSLDFWILYIYALQLLTTLPKIVVCSLGKRLCNISHTSFQNYIITIQCWWYGQEHVREKRINRLLQTRI